MKLADYLKSKELKPTAFARQAGVPASTISRILRGERSGLMIAEKIKVATGGAVTANDLAAAQQESAA
jgi:predicted transcriptional regulator